MAAARLLTLSLLAFSPTHPTRHACRPRAQRHVAMLAATTDEPLPPPPTEEHLGRRTIGVDYGFRRTGVALSTGYSPQPLEVLETADNSTASHNLLVAQLLALAERTASVQFVVGMPLDQQGREGNAQSAATRVFATRLAEGAQARGHHVYVWDERGSTMEARMRTKNAVLKRNRDLDVVDALAAAVILEDFFGAGGAGAERLTAERIKVAAAELETGAPAGPAPSYKEWQAQARERARRQREVGGAEPAS